MTPTEEAKIERILTTIDLAKFEQIKGQSSLKYLDLPRWIGVNLRRAVSLGLDGPQGCRVLDIGAGTGYFLYVCRLLGHVGVGIDMVPRDELFAAVSNLLGVEVFDATIEPFVPLPELGAFDRITAHMITFNGHCVKPWGVEEWDYFIGDAMERLLHGGLLCLELNREPDTKSCYTPELRAFFVERGAEITGHYPHRPDDQGHRLLFRL